MAVAATPDRQFHIHVGKMNWPAGEISIPGLNLRYEDILPSFTDKKLCTLLSVPQVVENGYVWGGLGWPRFPVQMALESCFVDPVTLVC
jgi:hypothetical protein